MMTLALERIHYSLLVPTKEIGKTQEEEEAISSIPFCQPVLAESKKLISCFMRARKREQRNRLTRISPLRLKTAARMSVASAPTRKIPPKMSRV